MTTKQFKFKNGDQVREMVTGFTGIITGSVYYLTGCNQYLVTAKQKDEFSEASTVWYDEGRLEYIDNQITPEMVEAEAPGCDRKPPIK